MGLCCGMIGLPNVGKTTVFNALTGSGALAANYPFATVDPNTGIALVPDPRLVVLTDLFKSKKTTYSTLEVRDIAGLVESKTVEGAADKLDCFTYGDFKEQVLPYLSGELMDVYRDAEAFARQKAEVEQALLEMLR